MRRPRFEPIAAPRDADEGDSLIVTVRLASGRFESTIQIPLMANDVDKKRFVESWLDLMAAGVKCGTGERPHAPPQEP